MDVLLRIVVVIISLSAVGYLFSYFRLMSRLKNEQATYWISIGAPSAFNANGQVVIMRSIIFNRQLPEPIATHYRSELMRTRLFLSVGLLAFVFLVVGALWTA